MKKKGSYIKSALALALVVMMALSMMSGVLTLSANADEDDFPEVISEPIARCFDREFFTKQWMTENGITMNSGIYQEYMQNLPRNSIDIVLRLDNSKTKGTAHDLAKAFTTSGLNLYGYDCYLVFNNDYQTDYTVKLTREYAEDFDLLILSYDDEDEYLPASLFSHDGTGLLDMNNPRLELRIHYHKDNTEQIIPIERTLYENIDNTQLLAGDHTARTMLLRLAHSTTIDNESFYELENAIFSSQSVNEETTNKYYVDIESKDKLVLPMDNMTDRATLVQTRIGDNVVYNTEDSFDFLDSSVDAVSDHLADKGRVYYSSNLPWYDNVDYSSEEDWQVIAKNIQNASAIEYQGNYYKVNSYTFSKFGADLIDNGNVVFAWSYQERLDGTTVNRRSGYNNEFYVSIDTSNGNIDTSINRIYLNETTNNLIDYLNGDDCSDYLKRWMKESRVLWFFYYVSNGNSYSRSFTGTLDEFINLVNEEYSDTVYYISSIRFTTFNDSETKKHGPAEEDYDAYQELVDAVQTSGSKYGKTVNNRYTYKPVLESETTYSIKEYLGINDAAEQAKSVIPIFNNEGGFPQTTSYKTAIGGQLVPDAVRSSSPIIEDTFDNNEISVDVSKLDGIEKGVTYNVVNQIMLATPSSSNCETLGGYTSYTDGMYVDNSEKDMDLYYSNIRHPLRNIYYLNGEYVRNYYSSSGNEYKYQYPISYSDNMFDYTESPYTQYFANVRHTEYKWGEVVFASRPDPVVDLTYNEGDSSITWTKPVDEGLGVETSDEPGKTETSRTDDVVYVTDYTIKIYDEDGNEIYSANPERDPDTDDVKISLPEDLIEKDKHYTAVVVATNVIGDSDESVIDIYIPTPKVKIVMTPDKPAYREDETIVYTETVTNTGKVKLTDIIVTQDKPGTYDEQDGLTVLDGNSARIPDLEPGESYTFTYRVPASIAEGDELVNTADVATRQQVTDEDEAAVKIIHPAIKVTKEVDRHDYHIGDTVTWTGTITNTGDYPLTNIVVRETLDGKFIFADGDDFKETDDNAFIIPRLEPGESVTFKYETVIDEDNVNDDLYPCTLTAEAAEGPKDSDTKDVPVVAETDNDTESDTDSDSDSNTDTNSDTDTASDTDSATDSDSQTDEDSDSESDSDSTTDSEEVPVTDTDSATDTSTEDTSTEDTSTEDTSTEDTSTEDTSTEDTSTEDTSTEDTSTEDTSTEDTSTEDTSTEDTSTEDTSTEDTSTEDTSTEDTSTEDTSTEDTSTEDTSTEDTSTEDTSTEDTSTEDTSTEDTSTEDTSTDNIDTSTSTDTETDKVGGGDTEKDKENTSTDTSKKSSDTDTGSKTTTTTTTTTPVTYSAATQQTGKPAGVVTTGDSRNIAAYAFVMFAAMAVVVFASRKRKEDHSF